ncbi:MAG: hypothetical protein KC413_01015 [Anaerolineales bacterium]|nr:hypothetical protein [Anaerolineales bacterium]MCA9974290.1 hypothetical protein [Anaerolineales bacterium]
MRRLFPFLLFAFAALVTACASSAEKPAVDSSEQAGPVVTVFYTPA